MHLSQKFNDLYNKIILETGYDADNDLLNMLDEIRQIFNNKELKVNEKLLSKIYILSKRLLAGTESEDQLNTALLKNIKLNKTQAEQIVDELTYIVSPITLKALADYINEDDDRLNINDYIGRKIEFSEIMQKTQLPESNKLFSYLYNKEFNKLPKMGKLELFCAIIFSKRKKRSRKIRRCTDRI